MTTQPEQALGNNLVQQLAALRYQKVLIPDGKALLINLKPTIIKYEAQYQQYLDWVDKMFETQVEPGYPEGKLVENALVLIKDY